MLWTGLLTALQLMMALAGAFRPDEKVSLGARLQRAIVL